MPQFNSGEKDFFPPSIWSQCQWVEFIYLFPHLFTSLDTFSPPAVFEPFAAAPGAPAAPLPDRAGEGGPAGPRLDADPLGDHAATSLVAAARLAIYVAGSIFARFEKGNKKLITSQSISFRITKTFWKKCPFDHHQFFWSHFSQTFQVQTKANA